MLMPPEIKAWITESVGLELTAREPSAVSASFGLVSLYCWKPVNQLCQDYQVKLSNQGVALQVLKSALVRICSHRKNCIPN